MNAPPEIYLDARVARTIPTQQDNEGTPLVRYFSDARVKEIVAGIGSAGPEFIIQVQTDDLGLLALTNFGRLFSKGRGGEWKPVKVPDLAGDN